jgi:hypothetical protein
MRRPWNLAVKASRRVGLARSLLGARADGVTVVIVSWNTKEVVADVIEAVRRFSPPSTAVLVVDNGSTDGTRALLRSWPGIRRILLPRNTNHGVALDIAMGQVATRVAVVLDSDAIPLGPGWLDPVVTPIESDQADLAGSRARRGFVHPMYLAVNVQELLREHWSFQVHVAPETPPEGRIWGENAWDTAELLTPRLDPRRVTFVERTENAAPGLPGMTAGGVVYHHGGVSRVADGGATPAALASWRAACEALGVGSALEES